MCFSFDLVIQTQPRFLQTAGLYAVLLIVLARSMFIVYTKLIICGCRPYLFHFMPCLCTCNAMESKPSGAVVQCKSPSAIIMCRKCCMQLISVFSSSNIKLLVYGFVLYSCFATCLYVFCEKI